jgi:hypothetical protein
MTRYLPALLLLAAACSKSNSNGGTGPGPTGSLDVTITAPAGVSGKVNITTPSDSLITITSSQTINGLAPGEYIVRASAGVTADPIVSIAYTAAVTGNPATITAGQTANVTVTYSAPRTSSGILWVANQTGGNIAGFSSAQLSASGSPIPAVMIGNGTGSTKVSGPTSVAVDSSGGIWWVDNSDTAYYYAASAIASNTNAAATRKLVDTTASVWVGTALDPAGDLWTVDQRGTVKKFTPTQLAAGGRQTPAVVLRSIIGTLARPWQIAFDKKGDLWAVSYGDSTVVGFAPSAIQTSGQPVPFAAITGSPGISDVLGIAFDAQGNLWTATLTDTIAKFTPDQLTSLGSPTPSVILKMPTLTTPIGIGFDNSGSLWVAGYESSKLLKFTSNQLTTSGTPTPAVTITANGVSLALPAGIAFSPPAGNLPIP